MKLIENKGEYIFIDYREPYTYINALKLLKEAAEVCAAGNCNKLLLRFADMPGKVKTLDRFELGVQGAFILRRIARIAVVYRREEMDRFMETVAANRGLNIRLFDNMEEAQAWLDVK